MHIYNKMSNVLESNCGKRIAIPFAFQSYARQTKYYNCTYCELVYHVLADTNTSAHTI